MDPAAPDVGSPKDVTSARPTAADNRDKDPIVGVGDHPRGLLTGHGRGRGD